MESKPHKAYLLVLLLFISSCAKEIYTHEDAVNSKREAQKVGLTVMIRDVGAPITDLSGFTVSALQSDEKTEGVTSTDGIAHLMVIKGDVVLQVKKEGYVSVNAVVTTNTTDTERNNTVVIIPVFATVQASGTLNGMVSVKTDSSNDTPLAGAMVSIYPDLDEMMRLAFPGISGNINHYLPGILAFSSEDLMQPARTDDSGAFSFVIPVTVADLTYTVKVHETALTQNTCCSAKQTVVTNGQNCPVVHIYLMPYEK